MMSIAWAYSPGKNDATVRWRLDEDKASVHGCWVFH